MQRGEPQLTMMHMWVLSSRFQEITSTDIHSRNRMISNESTNTSFFFDFADDDADNPQ